MYQRFLRIPAIVPVLIMVPALIIAVGGVLGGVDEPKYVGGVAVNVMVAVLTLVVAFVGGRMPGLAMSLFGAGGVMIFATAWVFGGVAELLLWVAAGCMFLLCLWSALAKVDSLRDTNVSHFRR